MSSRFVGLCSEMRTVQPARSSPLIAPSPASVRWEQLCKVSEYPMQKRRAVQTVRLRPLELGTSWDLNARSKPKPGASGMGSVPRTSLIPEHF